MEEDRKQIGAKAGMVGMCLNFLLAISKVLIGIFSGSVSIIGDGVNNFFDAISSIVTTVSFKLASKKADKEHPYGHGRAEYVSGFIVSAVVIAVAIELGKTSISNIINHSEIDAGLLAIILLVVSIFVKFWMSVYYSSIGRKIGSSAMKAAAVDSKMDCIATTVALLSVLVFMVFKVNIDGYAGLLVALFVIWQGINSARETVEPLLGSGAEEKIVNEITEIALGHDKVLAVHDIRVHDYGPGRTYVSMHAELPYNMTLDEAHLILDEIETEVVDKKLASEITIHADPVNYDNHEYKILLESCEKVAKKIDSNTTIHDFHIINHVRYYCIHFDVCVPYECTMSDEDISMFFRTDFSEFCNEILDNDFKLFITVDRG